MKRMIFPALLFLVSVHAAAADLPLRGKVLIITHATVQHYRSVLKTLTADLQQNHYDVVLADLDKVDASPASIRGIVKREAPAMIHCIGVHAFALMQDYRDSKISFSSIINYRPLQQDLTHGIATEPALMTQLTTFRYFFPEVRRVGILYSRANTAALIAEALELAPEFDLKLIVRPVWRSRQVKKKLRKLAPQIDALWLIADPLVMKKETIPEIFDMMSAVGKPVYSSLNFSQATLTVHADYAAMGHQAADLIDDVLSGRPVSRRFQNPTGTHISLNQGLVTRFGLKLNYRALTSVNQFID